MSKLRRDEIDVDAIAKRLGSNWGEPTEFGADGWAFETKGNAGTARRIFVTYDPTSDPEVPYLHASISHQDRYRLPSYSDLKEMARGVFGDGYSYQCFAPESAHINITSNVLHLWGRADGAMALPDFGREGTI